MTHAQSHMDLPLCSGGDGFRHVNDRRPLKLQDTPFGAHVQLQFWENQ